MNTEIRVLHVIYALSGGGAERQLQFLIKHAPATSKHAVLCVEPRNVELKGEDTECFVHVRKGKFDWGLYYSCHDAINKFRPDVIHVWLPPVISIPSLVMAALHHKPVIFSYRNLMRFRRFQDVVEYFVALLCSTKVIANNSINQSTWPYRMLYRLKNGCTIPNGLDFSALTHKSYLPVKANSQVVNLIFIGRLVEQKNILNLIRALALLSVEFCWVLNVYGEGNQKASAIKLATELGIIQRIVFHGFEPNIFAKLAESDLLIMPSVREGMPNVLIEAMATPIPIVASEIAAITGIVKNSNAVILVNPYDAKSIATGISKYFYDPLFYNNNLEIGAKIALQYDAKTMSYRYYDEYKKLASK